MKNNELNILLNPPKVMTPVEMSIYLECSESMARKYVADARVTHQRIKGRVWVPREDVIKLKEELCTS